MKRAAIYARISVDRPEETSIESQVAACQRLIAERGWAAVGEFVDRGRSGGEGKRRPELDRLLADVATGLVDRVVVWKLDRWSRSVRDVLDLDARLLASGVEFVSVMEGLDTSTAMGRAMRTIMAILAELELESRRDRAYAWHATRKACAKPPSGPRLFGFSQDRTAIVEVEAEAIRWAAAKMIEGGTAAEVAREFNSRGIVPRRAARWTNDQVRYLLRNPGLAHLVDVDGELVEAPWEGPAILDRETHEAVVAVFADPSRSKWAPKGRRHYALVGFLFDAVTGVPMRGTNDAGRLRYRTVKGDNSVLGHLIEGELLDRIAARFDLDAIRKIADGFDSGVAEDLVEAEGRLATLATMFADGDLTEGEWREARPRLQARIAELHAAEAIRPRPFPETEALTVADAWRDWRPVERKAFLSIVIERIDLGRRIGARNSELKPERVEVSWRV